jgi:hypothetical protein
VRKVLGPHAKHIQLMSKVECPLFVFSLKTWQSPYMCVEA